MTELGPLVTILINNYNYARFLPGAIESALDQTYGNTEIVVVDDGSTDDSAAIIAKYSDRILPILKENGGQASALNAGIEKSKGDIICFLDADDYFAINKVQELVHFFQQRSPGDSSFLLYHLLETVDESGAPIGNLIPNRLFNFPQNLYKYACKYRFVPYVASPTSGLALTRSLAYRIFPLPTDAKIFADDFVVRASALVGNIYGIDKALGAYRVHGRNLWFHRRPLKSMELMRVMESFLNQRLQESNLDPVLSFFDSMDSRVYRQSRWQDMRLAFSVLGHHCDLKTFNFLLRTLAGCITRDYALDKYAVDKEDPERARPERMERRTP